MQIHQQPFLSHLVHFYPRLFMLSYKFIFFLCAAVDSNKAWNRQERNFSQFYLHRKLFIIIQQQENLLFIFSFTFCTKKFFEIFESLEKAKICFLSSQFFPRWLLNDHWLTAEDTLFFSMKNFSSFSEILQKKNIHIKYKKLSGGRRTAYWIFSFRHLGDEGFFEMCERDHLHAERGKEENQENTREYESVVISSRYILETCCRSH